MGEEGGGGKRATGIDERTETEMSFLWETSIK